MIKEEGIIAQVVMHLPQKQRTLQPKQKGVIIQILCADMSIVDHLVYSFVDQTQLVDKYHQCYEIL